MKKGDSIQGSSDNRKHVKFTLKYDILDDIVVKFIREASECGTAIDGPMIQTLTLRKAKKLGIEGFEYFGWVIA